MTIHLTSVLQHGEVAWREVAGELVILDRDGEVILGLNGTGGEVWKLLDGARPLGEIAASLARTHEQPVAEVEKDVLAFAETLISRKFAVVRN